MKPKLIRITTVPISLEKISIHYLIYLKETNSTFYSEYRVIYDTYKTNNTTI